MELRGQPAEQAFDGRPPAVRSLPWSSSPIRLSNGCVAYVAALTPPNAFARLSTLPIAAPSASLISSVGSIPIDMKGFVYAAAAELIAKLVVNERLTNQCVKHVPRPTLPGSSIRFAFYPAAEYRH